MLLPLALAYARKYWWMIAIALALASTLGYIKHLQHQRDAMLIEKNNALAAKDSLTVKYHNDSIVVVGILGTTRTDLAKLREDYKLLGKSKTITTVVVKGKPVHEEHDTVAVNAGPESFTLSDSVIGPPADVKAQVALIMQPDSSMFAHWVWDVRPSPIGLTINVGCLAKFKPNVLVGASPWVQVDSVATEVSRDVCGEGEKTPHKTGYYVIRGSVAAILYGLGRARVP